MAARNQYIPLSVYQALSAELTALAALTGTGVVSRVGTAQYSVGGVPGTGTVTSVALSLPAIFSVSGSPVTAAGTLTGTLATQAANLVWAGPATGVAASPTFRALVAADIPDLSGVYLTPAAAAAAYQPLGAYGIDLGGSRSIGDRAGTWFTVPEWKEILAPRSGSWTFRFQTRTADGGTTVTARLYNMTAAGAVSGGTGSASSSTSWVEGTPLTVTLVAGNRYRMELLSGDEDADVFGVGRLEP